MSSAIGLHSGAFFVGRTELLAWLNNFLQLDIAKIEDASNGAAFCQVADALFPGSVPMSKVNFDAKYEYEAVKNFKILQACFDKHNVDKVIDVEKLVKGKSMDNLEFLQWLKFFFDQNYTGREYDPVARRKGRKPPTRNVLPGTNLVGTTNTSANNISVGEASVSGSAASSGASSSSSSAAAGAAVAAPTAKSGGASRAGAAAAAGGGGAAGAGGGAVTTTTTNASGGGQAARSRKVGGPVSGNASASQASAPSKGGKGGPAAAVPAPAPTSSSAPAVASSATPAHGSGSGAQQRGGAAAQADMKRKVADLMLVVAALEKERDFYFGKLREIEIICQEREKENNPILTDIQNILYATEEDFVIEGDAAY